MVINIQDLFHVRNEQPSGSPPGVDVDTAGLTWTVPLNTILTNEITGASLVTDQITLPTGTYLIEGWSPTFRGDQNACHLYNITDAGLELEGSNTYSSGGADTQQCNSYIRGRFIIAAEKVFELRHYLQRGSGGTQGLGVITSSGFVEVYGDIRIYKIVDDLDTFHVRHEVTGGSGGNSSAGNFVTRILDTVMTNEISGASLSSNQVILPAGTYMIKGWAPSYRSGRALTTLYNVTDDTYDIIGEPASTRVDDFEGSTHHLAGRLTISDTKTFELRMYNATTQTDGLGRAVAAPGNDVYSDLYIQLQPS